MRAVFLRLALALATGSAVAGAIPKRAVPPNPDKTDQLLCIGKVFSIYAMGNGVSSDERYVDVINVDGSDIAGFDLGTTDTSAIPQSAMFTLLSEAFTAQSTVLLSYVVLDKSKLWITGVYVPPEHYNIDKAVPCGSLHPKRR